MAGPLLNRFRGFFRMRDASDPTRVAAVSAAGEISFTGLQLGEVQATPTANTVLDRLKTLATELGGVAEATPTDNTIPSGLNGRLQRIAQNILDLITLLTARLPTALNGSGHLKAGVYDANGVQVADFTAPVGIKPDQVTVGAAVIKSASTSSANFVSTNPSRRGLILANSDANPCFVKFGATASVSDFNIIVAASQSVVIVGTSAITNQVDCVWGTAGTGKLALTEI